MTAGAANIIHEFYVPLPESQVKAALVSIEPASGIVGNTIESVVSIVATGAGSVIHYDHWEDGYEVDLNNPTQSTTLIWGDGNNANGIPPGYANDPSTFTAGSVIVLRNQVPLPRNPANRLYDGRDRFGGTKALVVSRASWATTPGTVLCGANEVLATMDYGTQYVAPIGDDVSSSSMFEYAGLFVMARDDATTVAVDADGAGAGAATNITLNRGESYLINGGIKKGATVNAGKPVQVQLVTGDIGARYESRRFTLYPRDQWSDVTYSPVGTAANGHQAYAFIYNPNASSITINVTTSIGSASFPVAANAVYQYQLPQNSGAKFLSASGADFFGVVTVGANPSSNNVHDWGFSMVPSDNLTTEAVVGWGPGSENLTQNGSPVWVTPTSAARIYVDYNGDRAGPLTDPKGNKYDAHLDVGTMESRRVSDPDKDQTAMRLYTLDGTTITAAWGQDPAVAGPALPYLDCGTTVLPFPVPTLIKSYTIFTDLAPAGLSINDTIEYRIDVDNKGLLPLGNLLVLDPLNASLTYVAGSTKRDGATIADGSTGTAFPLDEGGYVIPIILRGGMTTFTYRCTINSAGNIANTATNSNYNLVSTASVVVPPGGGSTACGAQFTNAAGVVQPSYLAGALIHATMTDPDANNDTGAVENITVVVNNTSNGDAEFVTLVETGANTGIFRNTTGLTTSTTTGSSQMDGTLLVTPGNSLSFSYTDPEFNETCTGNAVIAVPTQNKYLYLSDPSQALDRVDPVAAADGTTANTATLGLGAGTISVVGAAASSNAGQTVSSYSFSYNSGSTGSNRILMVGISYRDGDDELVTGVTYGGQAMTSVGTRNVDDSTAPDGRIYIYRLYNPPTGANSLAVTWSSALDEGAVVGAITYAGVDISGTPLGTFASAAVTTGNPSVNVPSASGDLVFGVVGGRNSANYTVTGGGTALWAAIPFSGQTAGAAQSKTATTTSTTISFGSGSSGNALLAAIGGVALKAAPAGGTPTATFTQAPTFASTFTMPVGATPTVTAYYNVVSGSMPASPSITATLKRNTTTIATSTAASASGGLLTFTFGALGSAVNFAASDYMVLDITTAQTGVTFTVQFDSTTRASKITLPTTTVIDVNALGVYDAPYPAGSLITGLTSGTTAYVRGTVSDPFGHADITSMGLDIDGPGASGDISTTLNAAHVVTTTAGTKTYEYAWTVGATTGTYNIAVTANEGTEGIQATRATTVIVTMLDLGTPSTTEFTTGVNGPGTPTYAGNETVCVRVTDLDQNTNAAVAETVTVTITTASGDSEVITLTETGVNTGVFAGSIPASTTTGAAHDSGTLFAVLGELLTVVYVDPTDPTDTSNDTATIPNIAPAVSVNKTLVTPADGIAVIGETLQYTVQVANTGNTTLGTITLSDTFPATKLSYVSASVTPNTIGSGSLGWTNVGPLSPGQSITITLNFTALDSAAPATNTALANAGGGVTGGDTADVTITDPVLSISKTLLSPNPGPANINADVVFRITLQNTGDTAIATLPLEDTFSGADFTFVSATQAPDASGNGSLLWNDVTGAGNLAVGASTIIDVTLRANGAAAPANNLASANYTVDVNGDTVPAVNSSASITLLAAKITGHVYNDADQSVTFNAGDSVFGGVTVSLYTDPNNDGDPADGTLVSIATTGADGVFEFVNLVTGYYVIVESQPAGYSSSGDTQGANNNRIALNVIGLTTYANNNFFDFLTPSVSYASIAGRVWNDANASATVTGGEAGIENVAVDLVEDSNGNGIADSGEPVVSSTLTAADGTYAFTGLGAGNYVVVEHDLFGWYSTADVAAPNNNMIPVTATAGSSTTGRDFLDVLTGTVGGKVFHDVDGNGSFGGGDAALAGIDVVVTNSFGVAQTVVTDASGDWTATVPPGSTHVNVDQVDAQFTAVFTTGYQQTAGTDPNSITAVSSVNTPAGDDGFRRLGSITGAVLADTDNDDDGDDPISGVTLTLKDSSGNDIDSDTVTAGIQPTATTTDGSGVYTFANVPQGTYRVVETDPAGYFSVTSNTVNPVNVVAGSTTSGVNFVDEQAGSISGTVLADADNDDDGDVAISGVTLTLKDSLGNDIDSDAVTAGIQPTTTTTNGSGAYSFTNLVPGTYQVVETDPAGYFSVSPNTVNPVNVVAGTATANVNFVDEQPGSITGFVRADTNNDDTGDVLLGGVTLTLKDGSGDDIDSDAGTAGIQPTTTITNGSGIYTFANLPPGTYRVVETDLAGYFSVTANTVNPVNVPAGAVTSNVNFVDEQAGSITGTVLADADNDDDGDVAISGVTLTLKDGSGNDIDSDAVTPGIQPTTTTTNGSGAYSFANLVPGTYGVVETDPAGYLSVTPNSVTPVNVVAGTATANVDFVDEQPGSISGTVLADADNDDDGDTAISGVTLTLKDGSGADIDSDAGTAGIQPTTTTTNGSGAYSFPNLPPGAYRVVETDLAGYISVTSNTVSPVVVNAGAVTGNVNFVDEQAGSISGTVLADIDNDDDGDDPISGVTLTLKDGSGNDIDSDTITPGIQPTTTTSDGSGAYSFAGLPPGTYRVVETDPSGYLSITPNTVSPVSVVAGTATSDVNFVDEQVGSITGTVLADMDNDDDGDDPISGVTLTLKDSSGADIDSDAGTAGIQPTTTTTNASGVYTFAGLAPGGYRVVETDLAGYFSVTPNTVSSVNVVAGATTADVNFVDEQAGSISGSVLADTDNDDDGDDPISGVTLTLKDSSGNDIDSDTVTAGIQPTTTTTDGGGAYSFVGLAPGTYRVVETDLPGYFSVSPNTVSSVNVVAGATTSDVNFVDEQPGTISGTVLADVDNDDDGDDAISGVTLTLKDGSGNDIDSDDITPGIQPTSTTTNASGAYSFAGLAPGIYRVVETDAAGYFSVTSNMVSSVNVVAGAVTTDVNFVDEQAGSISGSVLADTDNDDDGDDPISGVTLTLKDSGGHDVDSDDIAPGVQPTTTTTNASGAYSFTGLRPGTYRVVETDPAGYLSVTPNTVTPVSVVAGTATSDVNFVDEQPGSIAGSVLADTDNDDDGDVPISGVTLTLKDSSGNDIDSDTITPGIQPTTTTTNGTGAYSFSGLPPGSYRVVETDPAGYLSVTSNTLSPVVVVAGATTSDVNFVDEQSVTIGNLVWNDSNNDGLKDGGEPGIDGIVVELLDGSGASVDSDSITPGVQPTLSTTAGGGLYSFANVAPGLYRLRVVTTPAGYPLSSTTTSTADDQQDDDDNGIQATPSAATLSPVIELAAGEADDTIDFGFTAIVGVRAISGQVRDDYDLDGNLSDSDQPVPSVTVRLYADTNDNGVYDDGVDQLVRTTATNGLGGYSFTGLPDGSYFVQEVDPLGSTSTKDTQGGNDNLIFITLAGSDSTGNDFLDAVDPAGYAYDVVTGEIIAGGGISVSGPPGAGITILLDGSTGQYSFITDGTPGSYTLTYTPPIGYIIDPARPVAGPSLDPTGQPDPYALGSSEDPLNPGFMADATGAANPYYLTFDLASGDPFVINNNIPLRLRTPRTWKYWKKITGGGPNPGSNPDGDCYTDLVEYALNLNPNTGVQTSPAFRGVRNTLTGRLDVSYDRVVGGVTDVTYTLMGIGSLATSPAGWTALSRIPTVTVNGDGTETVTFADVESDPYFFGVKQGFVRLQLGLDEDGDTVTDSTASTPAFGWTRRTLNTECVMTGYPYLKDKNFCGTIDAVVGTTLNVTTSAGGSSVVMQFAPGRQYFVEIFSGDNAGHRFDIDEAASTATSIALVPASLHNTLTTIPASLTGDKAVIREHHTLNDLFPRTQFAATNDPSTGDRVLFYDRVAGGFKIYWLFANLGNPYWVLTDDATLADQSSVIVDPAEGWFTHPKGVPQEVVWHGMVRANPFACPLAAGPNFVGSGYPMDQSPAMRGMTTFAGFRGSRDPTQADELLFWKGYTSTQSMAYYNHFLLSSGALQQWTELGNASLINENNLFMFKPTTGSIYKMRLGLPSYVMPMPWTP